MIATLFSGSGTAMKDFFSVSNTNSLPPARILHTMTNMGGSAETFSPHPAVTLAEKRLRFHLDRHLNSAQVWLFGSRAKGTALRRSDFDIAFAPKADFKAKDFFVLEDAIRNDPEIIYPVDLINLRDCPEALGSRIKEEGVPWKN